MRRMTPQWKNFYELIYETRSALRNNCVNQLLHPPKPVL